MVNLSPVQLKKLIALSRCCITNYKKNVAASLPRFGGGWEWEEEESRVWCVGEYHNIWWTVLYYLTV
jgi:hypothetical protein